MLTAVANSAAENFKLTFERSRYIFNDRNLSLLLRFQEPGARSFV